ncbi:MAG: BREX-1 system phosphatase PglZ type B [Gammaproteobacteria bacterium]|nr:BREX-1 system phosphatase PglZ type B [Gammaproteobacteria bacterium]
MEQLIRSLRAGARYNRNDADAPAAVLWTDPNSQWQPIAGELRQRMPELLTLGDYLPETRTGPAIWLRTALEGHLPDVEIAEGITPVVYLPSVSRQTLRTVEECPDSLKPLVELQYRGTCWTQRNGKDWTVEAFLASADSLALDVRRDAATRTAMLGALPQLAIEPIANLKGKRLEREDFDRLLSEDLPRDVLEWLNDAAASRSAWSVSRWSAFRSRCSQELAFDPEEDGELVGAGRLGARMGQWDPVWTRFAESPASYQNVEHLLRRAKPKDLLAGQSSWPQSNESKEDELRQRLSSLQTTSQGDAIAEVRKLEEIHGQRRGWVWSKLGRAPLAQALRHLSRLADVASRPFGGASIGELAEQYTVTGYEVDEAALASVAAVRSNADFSAVSGALAALYQPWLEHAANRLQALAEETPIPCAHSASTAELGVDPGGVILFADGLRFDVSQRLTARMREKGMGPKSSWCWAGLPTVTATGKPAVSPVTEMITGKSPGDGFTPAMVEGGKTLTTDRFRRLLANAGYQVLSPEETGDPSKRGWTEDGSLDKRGHERKGRLAGHIEEEVELLLERVETLLAAGWQEVRVVTDHGWLWLPGGLPKVSLPHYLTESRWARCAAVKEDSKVEVPTTPWYWNEAERVALAPGIACFKSGEEYAHGGLSPQESIVPVITVASPAAAGGDVTIKAISWRGLRCGVLVEGADQTLRVQLRTKVSDPASALCESRGIDDIGNASLLLEDEDQEGSSAVVVVLDASGAAVAQEATIVGGE